MGSESECPLGRKVISEYGNTCLPVKVIAERDYVIPGWNDIASDKHALARDAFLAWVAVGRPRQGHEYLCMKRTRAQFKLAVRY